MNRLMILFGILVVGVFAFFFRISSGRPTAARLVPPYAAAAEGSDDDPIARERAEWLQVRDPRGNPLPRDMRKRELVYARTLDEFVSVAGAERDYGVVLTGALEDLTLAVDEAATKALRAERRT